MDRVWTFSLAKTVLKISQPHSFQLRPFSIGRVTEDLSLSGHVSRRSGAVEVEYRLAGRVETLCWPGNGQAAGRCHELWRQTCFELFFGIKGDPAYWEVNWGPCQVGGREQTCWNVYYFAGYRSHMCEEQAVGAPVCHVVRDAGCLIYSCTLFYTGLVDDWSDLEIGVSGVIKAADGSTSYWAIDHYGTKPDFHNRTSFSMLLPGVKN